ncbi:hypothetical protein B0T10DRAFT_487490, partial [Thelonectria olida]
MITYLKAVCNILILQIARIVYNHFSYNFKAMLESSIISVVCSLHGIYIAGVRRRCTRYR